MMVNLTYLGTMDYVVAGIMLSSSMGIGIYYAFAGGKQKTMREFLLADRQMGTFPVTMSIVASFLSAVSLLGIPSEVYTYGARFALSAISYFIAVPIVAYCFLPVFYQTGVTSTYEYLERRFNVVVRKCVSLIFILLTVFVMAMVMYAPALALNQVTGLNIWGSVVVLSVVCIAYTSIGGIKAVVWTDVLQLILMVAALATLIIKGVYDIGGLTTIWERNSQSGRFNFNEFDPNPLVRHTFWSLTIGAGTTWLVTFGVNQSIVQRYLITPTIRKAQSAIWWSLLGIVILILSYCFLGMILVAKYWDCDPLETGAITARDQLVPFLVIEVFHDIPGMSGLFVAGIFSASLSTMSSALNALSAVTVQDFLWPRMPWLSDKKITNITKLIAVGYGLLCILMAVAAEKWSMLSQMMVSIWGTFGGPILGVFMLGLFYPLANSMSVLVGLGSSLVISAMISVGVQISNIANVQLPLSTSACEFDFHDPMNFTSALMNSSVSYSPVNEPEDVFPLLRLSYLWYSAFSCSITVIVGIATSLLANGKTVHTDPSLVSPPVRQLYMKMGWISEKNIEMNIKEAVKFLPTENEMEKVEVKDICIV